MKKCPYCAEKIQNDDDEQGRQTGQQRSADCLIDALIDDARVGELVIAEIFTNPVEDDDGIVDGIADNS